MFDDLFGLIKEKACDTAERYKNLNRYIKTSAFLFFSLICVVIGLSLSGLKFCYRVSYNGEIIGTVQNKSDFNSAVKLALKGVNGKNAEAVIGKPEYSLDVSAASSFSSDDEIAEHIVDLTDGIVKGIRVTAGGKTRIFKTENKGDIVENYLCKFNVDAADCVSSFTKDVKVKEGLFLLSDIESGSIDSFLSSVPVKTVANIVTEEQTDFKVVTLKSSELVQGTTMVRTEGVNGVKRITEKVNYINGNETERTVLSEEIVSLPTDKVVVVGTAENPQIAAQKAAAHSCGFVFPLPISSCKLGDSFGGKRNHKGYDLLASYGTPIYAVKEGTVIRSSWYKGYGYCVDIDHGNGLVTRYGHASALIARVGQRVMAGDVIANVGQTGDAYGNHVHFEVILNGKRVNPAPYLNID